MRQPIPASQADGERGDDGKSHVPPEAGQQRLLGATVLGQLVQPPVEPRGQQAVRPAVRPPPVVPAVLRRRERLGPERLGHLGRLELHPSLLVDHADRVEDKLGQVLASVVVQKAGFEEKHGIDYQVLVGDEGHIDRRNHEPGPGGSRAGVPKG
jgi:hypothetical protein